MISRLTPCKNFQKQIFLEVGSFNCWTWLMALFAWRNIHAAQKLVKQGARMIIGNGEKAKVWQDQWIGQKPSSKALAMRWSRDDSDHQMRSDMSL